MHSGIALLNAGAPDALPEAIRCFDEAIELRRRLPLAANPGFRYGLAAGWINRGDAFTRLGGSPGLAEAVNCYTTAIEILKDPPAGDDGSFVRRLAIAWINRGIALEEQKHEPALAEAMRSYKEAIRLLGSPHRTAGIKLNLVLASAWINLGNASLRARGGALASEACEAAEQALSLLRESESKDQAAAEAGLKARHILCQAMIFRLGGTSFSTSDMMDLIGRITDAVESAMSLARSWKKAGIVCFRPLATQFFRLGALVYEKHQTHFLAEYILDHLEPEWVTSIPPLSATWFTIAEESLTRARCRLRNFDFTLLTTPQGLRQLEILNKIQAAEEWLRTLRFSMEQTATELHPPSTLRAGERRPAHADSAAGRLKFDLPSNENTVSVTDRP